MTCCCCCCGAGSSGGGGCGGSGGGGGDCGGGGDLQSIIFTRSFSKTTFIFICSNSAAFATSFIHDQESTHSRLNMFFIDRTTVSEFGGHHWRMRLSNLASCFVEENC